MISWYLNGPTEILANWWRDCPLQQAVAFLPGTSKRTVVRPIHQCWCHLWLLNNWRVHNPVYAVCSQGIYHCLLVIFSISFPEMLLPWPFCSLSKCTQHLFYMVILLWQEYHLGAEALDFFANWRCCEQECQREEEGKKKKKKKCGSAQ